MRIATYNVHDCVGRDGRFCPNRIAAVLRELDAEVVALQEITLGHGGNLIRDLSKAVGMYSIDGTLFERGSGRYGNVVLSRHAVIEHHLHDLSVDQLERRGAVDALLDIRVCQLRVCATHLGLKKRERRFQIEQLSSILTPNQKPTVLLGDFNVWRYTRELAPFARLGFEHLEVRSFPTWGMPLAALDRILVSPPAAIHRCWRHDTPLARATSDHFPVVADVEIAAQ